MSLTPELVYGPEDFIPLDSNNTGLVIDLFIHLAPDNIVEVRMIYVDTGSTVNVMYYSVYK